MDATLFYIATSSLYLRFAPRFLSIECVFVVVHFFLQKFSFRFSQKKVKYETFELFLSRDDEDEDDDGRRDPARRG